jgi:hypothetical protein
MTAASRGYSCTQKYNELLGDEIIEIGATVLEEFRQKHSKHQPLMQLRPNNAINAKTYNIG